MPLLQKNKTKMIAITLGLAFVGALVFLYNNTPKWLEQAGKNAAGAMQH